MKFVKRNSRGPSVYNVEQGGLVIGTLCNRGGLWEGVDWRKNQVRVIFHELTLEEGKAAWRLPKFNS